MKVSNTGPLIVLYETGLLSILHQMYDEVLVPLAVYNEISRVEEGVKLLDANPWIRVVEVKGKELVRVLLTFLDEGEAEAITLAKESNLPILLDERKGRRIAKSLGVRVEGTLGLLVRAKRRGLVSSVRELIYVETNRFPFFLCPSLIYVSIFSSLLLCYDFISLFSKILY